ncbi:MAG TPA: sulfotransferase family 2 domain-containing protein [Prolixibacteraceae bacterium]|nr:sulfotransferase family 2 domain-containing protein [Prolixibacteraceae bacterium]
MVLKRKIFFQHIPKTAGTSVNEMLARNYKRERIRLHIESERNNKYSKIRFDELDMVSGHLRLYEMKKVVPQNDFFTFTLVRDPFHQLLSHLNWVFCLKKPAMSTIYKNLPPSIRDLSLSMHYVDFKNLDSIKEFVSNMPVVGYELFDNCQTKYLMNDIVPAKLQIENARDAIQSLSHFDAIGTTERLSEFMEVLYRTMEWKAPRKIVKKNVSEVRVGFHEKLPGLREILYPFYCVDQLVYDHVSSLNRESFLL